MQTSLLAREWLQRLFETTWFTIGSTPITFSRLLGLAFILFVVWWVALAVERLIVRVTKAYHTGSLNESTIYALSRISRYIVWLIGVVLGLNFIGFDMGSLMLMGGALGVGIGFGLQNIFSNLVSGVIILLERTLKVGDFVDLQSGVMGRVSEINMRYTRVTTNDAVDIIVPNSEFINGRVTNWTFGNMLRRVHIPFGVAYGTDKDVVRSAALKAAASLNLTMEDATHKTDVWLVNLGDSSLDFELIVWIGDEAIRSPATVHAKYLWAIESELRNAGIEIPFPQRDLYLRSGPLEVNLTNK